MVRPYYIENAKREPRYVEQAYPPNTYISYREQVLWESIDFEIARLGVEKAVPKY